MNKLSCFIGYIFYLLPYVAYGQVLSPISSDMVKKISAKDLKLTDAHISALAIDHDDLWIGDWFGSLIRYDMLTQQVTHIRLGKQSLAMHTMNQIYVEDEYVWGIAADTIIRYHKQTGDTKYFANPSRIGYPQHLIRYKNRLLLAIKKDGLWEWVGNRFIKSSLHRSFLRITNSMTLWQDQLVAATHQGLYVYTQDQWQALPAFYNQKITLAIPQNHYLWVGSLSSGLHLYAADNSQNFRFSLRDKWLTCGLVQDHHFLGGTYEGGLASVSPMGKLDQDRFLQISPALLRIGALAYYDPYLIIGTLGDAIFLVHKDYFNQG
jgi:hypothetical protein